MTFNQFLRIIRARWVLVLSILTVVVLSTLGVSLMLTKQYTASATVMADSASPADQPTTTRVAASITAHTSGLNGLPCTGCATRALKLWPSHTPMSSGRNSLVSRCR